MKLYLLTRKDGNKADFDQHEGFVICAESPAQARKMAVDEAGEFASKNDLAAVQACDVWKDPTKTLCMVIGRPSGPITEPQVILSDFRAG